MSFVITYPGITGVVVSAEVTTSVGITPATIGIVCSPGADPDPFGDLVIGDGVHDTITFPDCLLQYKEVVQTSNSRDMILRLADRRWKWKESYPIDGHYNQQGPNRKLIPWTIASPYQLARLCLAALGEYSIDGSIPAGTIDLPGGLANLAVAGILPPFDTAVDIPVSPATDYLRLGENFTETKTNQLVTWQAIPAAIALAQLCDEYGRTVVLNPIDNKVRVVKIGYGTALPDGGELRTSEGNSVTGEPIPTEITAIGNPTRYQVRARFRAVGEDSDGNFYPHERLSFAPARSGQKMKVQVQGGTFDNTRAYAVLFNNTDTFSVLPGGGGDMTVVVASIAADINAYGPYAGVISATAVGTTLTVEAAEDGYEFDFTTLGTTADEADWFPTCLVGPITGPRPTEKVVSLDFTAAAYVVGTTLTVTVDGTPITVGPAGPDTLAEALEELAVAITDDGTTGAVVSAAAGAASIVVTGNTAGVSFTATGASTSGTVAATTVSGTTFTPKGFEKAWGSFGWLAQATANLSYAQAVALANKHIYRSYQLVSVSPVDENVKAIPVPGYGSITNRFRLVLQNSRPEPVSSRPGEAGVIDLKTGQPFAADTYNGYSVDRPNAAYGSVTVGVIHQQGLGWFKGTYFGNTNPKSYLPVQFSIIDEEKQVIQFSEPVYRILGRDDGFAALESDIVIEMGVLVLEPQHMPSRYSFTKAVGGFGPPVSRVFGDIQQEIITTFNPDHSAATTKVLDADAENRATYYTDEMARVLQLPDGQILRYGGVLSIPIDGLVRQVKYSLSKSGPFTYASSNSEFSRVVVPHQTRRKIENQSPDATRAMQNMLTDFKLRGGLRSAVAPRS